MRSPISARLVVILLFSSALGLIPAQTIIQAQSGPASLVADLTPTRAVSPSSNPSQFVQSGANTFFVAAANGTGFELWMTDGTVNGTMMVKDINPNIDAFSPPWVFQPILADINGVLFFWANDGAHGVELWKSDGTAAGTQLVKDIYPGSFSSNTIASPIFNLNGIAYFAADDGVNGTELWRSDGTIVGTAMVRDINPGSASSNPSSISQAIVSSEIYFAANDGSSGTEMWKSNRSTLETVRVMDLAPGPNSSSVGGFRVIGTLVYFTGTNTGFSDGYRVWKSDGTAGGTMPLPLPGAEIGTQVQYLTKVNASLFLATSSGGLWVTDGITTTMLLSPTINAPRNLVALGNILYFTNGGLNLWRSDGTLGGTQQIAEFINSQSQEVSQLTPIGATLYFRANDSVSGWEIWKSDGTPSGTVLVRDIVGGSSGSQPAQLANGNGTLYFSADNGVNGVEFWKSDGTQGGTVLVKDIATNADSVISRPRSFNGDLFFFKNLNPWKSNGISNGTLALYNYQSSGLLLYNPPFATAELNGRLLFSGYEATNGGELWQTDGTITGTSILSNIAPGNVSGLIRPQTREFITFQNRVFFSAASDGFDFELWQSDGTLSGTALFMELNPSARSSPNNFAIAGNKLYFTASNTPGPGLASLYASDGTVTGTVPLQQLSISTNENVNMVPVGSNVFFVNSGEVWRSDGTGGGTGMLKDINPIGSSNPNWLTRVGNTLFFTAFDSTAGIELWKSDGTDVGTVRVKDIYPGFASSSPQMLANVNGVLYFTATDPQNGAELWRSDGTDAGTISVVELVPGKGSSLPRGMTALPDGRILFTAFTDTTGLELWITDGTQVGTILLQDIAPGPTSANPFSFTLVGSQLFFLADDGVTGRELWVMSATPSVNLSRVYLPLVRR